MQRLSQCSSTDNGVSRPAPEIHERVAGKLNNQRTQTSPFPPGLVVKVSASGAEDPGFESRFRRDFSGSSHTSDFKIGTPVAALPGAWHCRVSAGTGRPCVSIL